MKFNEKYARMRLLKNAYKIVCTISLFCISITPVYAIENTALIPIIKRAKAGDVNAQFQLGEIYQLGRGVAVNYKTAKAYYEAAARQNHIHAQIELGLMYYLEQLGSNQLENAYFWLHKAAEADSAAAQWLVGVMNFNGQGVPEDLVESYVWLALASEKGHPRAKMNQEQIEDSLSFAQLNIAKTKIDAFKKRHGYELLQKISSASDDSNPVEKASPPAPVTVSSKLERQEPQHNYLIQVGAFKEQAGAKRELRRLLKKAPAVLTEKNTKIFSPTSDHDVFYRLKLIGYQTKKAAIDQCLKLKAMRISCFVAPP